MIKGVRDRNRMAEKKIINLNPSEIETWSIQIYLKLCEPAASCNFLGKSENIRYYNKKGNRQLLMQL